MEAVCLMPTYCVRPDGEAVFNAHLLYRCLAEADNTLRSPVPNPSPFPSVRSINEKHFSTRKYKNKALKRLTVIEFLVRVARSKYVTVVFFFSIIEDSLWCARVLVPCICKIDPMYRVQSVKGRVQ